MTNTASALITDTVKVSQDNSTIAIALKEDDDSVPFINIYKVNTGEELSTITDIEIGLYSMGLSPDGSRLLSMDFEDNITVWDTQTGKKQHRRVIEGVDEVFYKGNDPVIVGESFMITFDESLQTAKATEKFGSHVLLTNTLAEQANKIISSDFKYLPYSLYGSKFTFFEKDGKFILYSENEDAAIVLDAASKKHIGLISPTLYSPTMKASPRQNEVWFFVEKEIHSYNMSSQQQTAILNLAPLDSDLVNSGLEPFEEITDIEFTPDGKTALIIANLDGETSALILLKMEDYTVKRIVDFDDFIYGAKFVNDDRVILLGDKPKVWSLTKGLMVDFVSP